MYTNTILFIHSHSINLFKLVYMRAVFKLKYTDLIVKINEKQYLTL